MEKDREMRKKQEIWSDGEMEREIDIYIYIYSDKRERKRERERERERESESERKSMGMRDGKREGENRDTIISFVSILKSINFKSLA